MRKLLIFIGVIIVIIIGVLVGLRINTKSHSPIDIAEYQSGNIGITVKYCQPYKKGRVIFGELVPYNEVWRTGANEATTITIASNVYVQGNLLPVGTYSLWTIPGESEWKVIFNKEYGQWGVKLSDGKANYDKSENLIQITVPSYESHNEIEQFTIQFEKMDDEIDMIMMWDKTLVVVPFKAKN